MFVVVVLLLLRLAARWSDPDRRSSEGRGPGPRVVRRGRGDHGQTTAEYALVLIGAAALALLFITWATKTDRIGALFDFVMDQIMGRAR